MSELFKIGSSALLGNQNYLQTVSNNIANLNTPGYSRQRTEFNTYVEWGLGRSQTVQLFDRFAVDQFRRDSAKVGYAEKYRDNANIMDNLFSDKTTSIARGIDDVFARLNETNEDPTGVVPRQLFLSDSEALISKMQEMSQRVLEQEEVLSDEISFSVSEANSIINGIHELNQKIVESQSVQPDPDPNLVDERSELVRQISEKMGLQTLAKDNGTIELTAPNGQPILIDGSAFNMRTIPGDPDPQRIQVEIYPVEKPSQTTILDENKIAGELGALFDYRKEVLDPTINSLGQMTVAFADSMNEQNKLGVDLEGNFGGKLFNVPDTKALGFTDNSSLNHDIDVRIEEGFGDQVTNLDYQIEFTNGTDYTIQAMQNGELVGTVYGPFDSTAVATPTVDYQGSDAGLPDGLEMRFDPDGGAFTAGDRFILRPTRLASLEIEMNIDRPEQLALAAAINIENPKSNLGSGEIKLENITNTSTVNANDSGFTNTPAPGLDTTAPAKIVYTLAGAYEVQDSLGAVIGTVASGDDVMAQVRALGVWPTPAFAADYPGYEVSVEGTPQPGDEFNMAFNADGFDNNYNGLQLADLQTTDTVRGNSLSGIGASFTYGEAYSNIVGTVGDTANRANIDYEASEILLSQSKGRVDEVSGVNLDEEAADLVRYEQAYNASTRIISIAQSTFDTILQAVR